MADAARKSYRVGLTGGIASGKSTVADEFLKLGVPVIDTDVIAREVVEPGSPALSVIRDTFGDQVILEDGSLDRKSMRKLVFSDDDKRLKLESILHPLIRQQTEQALSQSTAPYVIVVVPLLAESPMQALMDRILVVDCSEATQIERLMARDVETEQQARRIMATQSSRKDRNTIADDIVNNDGDLKDIHEQVLALHHSYEKLAAERDF